MNAIHVRCPAKINLTLEILGKRPDGYHELRTVFQALSLYDELTVAPAEQDAFTVTGLPGAPTDDSNLCLKALRLSRSRFDTTVPVAVTLHKCIPMQAGLGGGSSDAAGMLAALERLYPRSAGGQPARAGEAACPTGREGSAHGVAELAAQLGSDVAFFLHGGAMLGSGRGELLEPLPPLRAGALVLALPPVAMGTAEAYGLIRPDDYTDGNRTTRLVALLRAGSALPEVAAGMYNVFAAPVERHRPEIAALRQRLQALPAQAVLLCGSGAAVGAVLESAEQAEQAAAQLRADGLWAVSVRPVPHGLQVTEQ
ncbi:4-(cytidine 5'-diphospho)-2-C-methyl-D-erythritol kinase [bacterium]|nr:4-(cytidine 5'-diphospho)-2-C-methyl-D-erythritol kinase [bacterium]